MKTLVITKIELQNFRGLHNTLHPHSKTTEVHGLNGSGKTSLQEAWTWVLTGYTNATSVKNFDIYDSTKPLTPDTPATKVTADVVVTDDETNQVLPFTITRSAKPTFVRKRGTNTYEKSASDTYEYYIDNIETSVSGFEAWKEQNIAPADKVVFCLDGSFFPVLTIEDAKKARKVLEDMVGEVRYSDLKGDYTKLQQLMEKGYTIEQVTEQQKTLRKSYEDSLAEITMKIKSKEDELARLQQTDFDNIELQINEKKQSIKDIDNAILGKAESIKPILGKRDQIFEVINSKTLKLNECRNTYLNKHNALKNDIKGQISNIDSANANVKYRNDSNAQRYDASVKELNILVSLLETLNKERERLLKLKDEVKSRVFSDDKCVFCGQELPTDMLEEKKRQFSENKQRELGNIIAQGKNVKERIENTQKAIEEAKKIVDKGLEVEPYQSTDELQSKLDEMEKSFVPYENTNEYRVLFNEIENLKQSLPQMPENDTDALTNMKETLITALEQLNRQLGRKDDCDKLRKEIDELINDKRECANKQSETEGILQLIKDYVQEKANFISDKINDRLEVAKIQMFRTQKDGQLAPDCVVMNKQGVKYATANGAQKIEINLDIQRMFCHHFGITTPIFVDECSMFSPSLQPHFDTQNIKFFASDDRTIRIVYKD